MRIKKLAIRNFKGIGKLDIDMDCNDVSIYGCNGTGKTTIYDAFMFLFFDKDSENKKDFNIKPLEDSGESRHNLESIVEAVLIVDGNELTLKKCYYEKWTKQRTNKAKLEFTGHTTDYFVNLVPSKKKEFEDKIKSIADEKTFKLLTSPTYFNEQLHWTDRRKILLEVCGDIEGVDVVKAEPKLKALEKILATYKLDEYRKILVSKMKEINEQLEKIPVRIDEVDNGLPSIEDMNFEEIQEFISGCRDTQEKLKQMIRDIDSGDEISNKKKQLVEIETELIEIKNKHSNEKSEAVKDLRTKADEATEKYKKVHLSLGLKKNEVESLKKVISILVDKGLPELRTQWGEENSKTLEFTQETVCPTCGQGIPEWKLEEAKDKALKAFNLEKSRKLEKITETGKTLRTELEDKQNKLADLVLEQDGLEKQVKELSISVDAYTQKLEGVESKFEDATKTAGYMAKTAEKYSLEEAVKKLQDGNKDEIDNLNKEIAELENQIQNNQTEYAKKEQHEKSLKRIEELEAEERKLAAEYEKWEAELFLTDLYIKTEVSLLEGKINSRFKMAKFKLFKQQINGGIEPCCEVTYNGVPYSDLNHGARINVGCDIISTLSEHYGLKATVFVDNRESLSSLIDMDCQVISLIVSEDDKKLRIKVEEEAKEEVA